MEENMKIVINRCYGGFGLSYEGVMYYAKLKGIKLYAYVRKWEDNLWMDKPYNASDKTIIPFEKKKSRSSAVTIYYATKKGLKNEDELNKYSWSEHDIKRDDPALVKTVEDLGERANTQYSELKVIEIPDDVDWEITEHNNWEQVEEKHRVWT